VAGTATSRITRKATTKTSPVRPLTGIRLVATGSDSPRPIIAEWATRWQRRLGAILDFDFVYLALLFTSMVPVCASPYPAPHRGERAAIIKKDSPIP
jgi:hypothetical protein